MISIKETIPISKMGVISQKIYDAIREISLPGGFHNFAQFAVSELFMNIKEHSMSVTMEVSLKMDKKSFSFSLRDHGIGLRKSYEDNGLHPKDAAAAIQRRNKGLSTKNTKERGYGFYSIKKLVSELGGRLQVTSDASSVILENNTLIARIIGKKT